MKQKNEMIDWKFNSPPMSIEISKTFWNVEFLAKVKVDEFGIIVWSPNWLSSENKDK